MSTVKLFKADNQKLYMRLTVTRNFYFNKVGVLEIKSGSKSYYAKDTKQYKLDRTTGQFTIEIYPNYVITLRDHGISGIVFGGAETDFTKKDAAQVKKIANCLNESMTVKK